MDVDGPSMPFRAPGGRDKPAFVMLHGFPSSSHMVGDLPARHLRVLAPELPGFGHGDPPSWPDGFAYTLDAMSDKVEALLAGARATSPRPA